MRVTFLLSTLFAALLYCGSAAAQSGDDRMDELLQELDALIEKGAAQSLADPWFLDDLRALSARYGETWPLLILDHSFDSQGALPKAPWVVRQGEMKMDWSRGLRSRVEARASAQGGKSDEEVVGEIIGGLLGQALGTGSSGTQARDPSEPALALAELRVTNAFQMQTTVSARPLPGAESGGLELGVYQGGNAGYRLVMVPRQDGGGTLSIVAVSSRGSVRDLAAASFDKAVLNDEPFTLEWSRRPDGAMAVLLDGQPVLSVVDRSFRDAFNGLMIGNRGGDYAVRQMTVKGAE